MVSAYPRVLLFQTLGAGVLPGRCRAPAYARCQVQRGASLRLAPPRRLAKAVAGGRSRSPVRVETAVLRRARRAVLRIRPSRLFLRRRLVPGVRSRRDLHASCPPVRRLLIGLAAPGTALVSA